MDKQRGDARETASFAPHGACRCATSHDCRDYLTDLSHSRDNFAANGSVPRLLRVALGGKIMMKTCAGVGAGRSAMFMGVLLSSVSILAVAAVAAPITITNNPATPTNLPAPNTTGGVGAVTVSGKTFTNQGMVGAGRFTATGRDFNGDTLGSFSGMTFLRETWRRDPATGQYSGGLLTLPDRGPNFALTGFPGDFFSNYNGRLNSWNFTFSPYAGANLPQATTSQSQVTLTPNGGFFLRDFNGNAFTGLEPGSNTFTQNGFLFGGPLAGLGAGKISLDAEAVARAADGTFYVSDEYQAGIFHFDATGKLIGYIPATGALTPRVGGVVNFTTAAAVAGQTGRRLNQGLEGLSITPDGKTLWVMLQSAALQDSTLGNDALRTTTRLIGYDISGAATPTTPIAEYVMELPVFNRGNTNGTITAAQASNRTAAQSEILALNGTQFLVLSRDGNGLGNDAVSAVGNDGRPPVFKSIMLIDTAGATNIAGTARQTAANGTVVTAPGVLDTTITPVSQVQLVNLINVTELTRFGISLATGLATTATTISEKWEAMGILPTLEEDRPQDVFLFVGNDNDFQTTNGQINAGITNGTDTLTSYNSGFVNDNMFMVFRLTLPTYVDPLYLEAMTEGAPITIAANAESGYAFGGYGAKSIDAHLDSSRKLGHVLGAYEYAGWVAGTIIDIDPPINGRSYEAAAMNGTVAVEMGLPHNMLGGVALSVLAGDADVAGGFKNDTKSVGLSLYAGYAHEGIFGQVSLSYALQEFDDIERPSAYGLTAFAETDGSTYGIAAKAGYIHDLWGMQAGPIVAASWFSTDIDGYVERGASGGNAVFPDVTFERMTVSGGFETTFDHRLRPSFHAYYTLEDNTGDDTALVSLASAQSAMGTQSIGIPDVSGDTVTLGVSIQGDLGGSRWHLGYDADVGIDEDDDLTQRVTFGVAF